MATGPRTPITEPDTVNTSNFNIKNKRDIGKDAVWSLSSAKPGCGVEQLRDGDFETYWQSDGTSPHIVSIQFPKRVLIEEIGIYTNFRLDESYTPSRISLRMGTNFHDLQDIKIIEIGETDGWTNTVISAPGERPVITNMLQMVILQNHQNGRDSHIRQIRVLGPQRSVTTMLNMTDFQTADFAMHGILR